MMKNNKEIWVFAGPNGSGKSTIVSKYMDGSEIPKYYITPDNIISRYERSMSLLPSIIEVADIVKVYDNSVNPTLVFEKNEDGKLILHNRERRHSWVDKYITIPLKENGIIDITDLGFFDSNEVK